MHAQTTVAAMLTAISLGIPLQADASTASASATLDWSSFHYTLVDLDLNDGITPVLTFNSLQQFTQAELHTSGDGVTIPLSDPSWAPNPPFNSTHTFQQSTASIFASADEITASRSWQGGLASPEAVTSAGFRSGFFTLVGAARVDFEVDYTIESATDFDPLPNFFASTTVSLIADTENSAPDLDSGVTLNTGQEAGTLSVSLFNHDASTSGYIGTTAVALVTAVPEPSEYLMLLAGLGIVGWAAKRRRAFTAA